MMDRIEIVKTVLLRKNEAARQFSREKKFARLVRRIMVGWKVLERVYMRKPGL